VGEEYYGFSFEGRRNIRVLYFEGRRSIRVV